MLVDEHRLPWERAFELTTADARLHEPHAAARGARELAAAAAAPGPAAPPPDHRGDQPRVPLGGEPPLARRHRPAPPHVDHRGVGAEARPHGAPRDRRQPLRERRRRAPLRAAAQQPVAGLRRSSGPGRFSNKTNGVTPRRWLLRANPGLAKLVTDRIGDGWIQDLERLRELEPLADDEGFRAGFRAVKRDNKERLAKLVARADEGHGGSRTRSSTCR